ncbi:MAG: hypothetical protein EOO75_00440, partial [Myxococcales bacterium]
MPSQSRWWLAAWTLAAGLLTGAGARAKEPTSRTGAYSPYEEETIRQVLRERGWERDPAAEGKEIESVEVVALDVIEPRDPAPQLLNVLHVTSRDHVIRREVLLRQGEPFRKVLVDETARNLRLRRSQLSLVVCVAARGSSPDRVRLVVITKDIWSLRVSWDAALSPGGVESLVLAPSETNLLGRQQTLRGRFELLPESYSLGLRYVVPRLLGTRVATALEGGVILERQRNALEGSYGTFTVERPLFATFTPWAFRLSLGWRNEILRRYVNAQLSTFDAAATAGDDALPFLYRSLNVNGLASATRSFGWAIKNDLTAGLEVLLRRYRVPGTDRYPAAVVDEFTRTKVPTTDDRVSPFVQWSTYSSDFLRTLDVDTLALQEDIRLGHNATVRLYVASADVASSRTLFGLNAGAGYTFPLANGYARLGVVSTTEHQAGGLADGALEAALRLVSPRLPIGRLLVDAVVLNRYRNYLNRTVFLGGDTRLRGWPSSYLVGKDTLSY